MTDATAGPAPRAAAGPMLAADGTAAEGEPAPGAAGAEAPRADADRAAPRSSCSSPSSSRSATCCSARSRTRSCPRPCRAPSRRCRTGIPRSATDPRRAGLRGAARRPRRSRSSRRPTPASAQRLNYEYLRHVLADARRRARRQEDGPGAAVQGPVHRGRQEVGRSGGLADDQALLRPLHRRATC